MTTWQKRFIKTMINDISQEDKISIPDDFKSCSLEDLDRLIKLQGVSHLPELYRQFMLHMGNGFVSRADDMLWTVDELSGFNKADNNQIHDDMFIFMWHKIHSYTLYGFISGDEDNPLVFT